MQPMTNYPNLPVSDDLRISADPEFQPDSDVKLIRQLWDKVCLHDLDALEAIHLILYPVLLKYVDFIIKDSEAADEIIADAFVHFWHQKSRITGERLKISLVKYLRKAAAFHLISNPIDCEINTEVILPGARHPVIFLSSCSKPSFKEKAVLRDYLGLDQKAVAEIMSN